VSKAATWRSPDLGTARTLELSQGRLRCFEAGDGPPLVFVHGLLVNANLWRKVVAELSASHRCITLDMPLGAHLDPVPHADLTPPGLAGTIAEAIEALELGGVTLVGNDTGGALCQLVAASRPDVLDALALTSSDAFEDFPPKLFRFLAPVARAPWTIPLLFAPLRLRAPRRLPIAFGWVTKEPIEPRAAEDSYVLPVLTNAAIRNDTGRVLRAIHPRYTLEAAEKLRSFDRPTLIAWSSEDKLFPREHPERLASMLPDARLEWVEGARTFSPEDRPERVASLLADFVAGLPSGRPAEAADTSR
jgi:pimeloyl-ACP methyl ester carboxylesterase